MPAPANVQQNERLVAAATVSQIDTAPLANRQYVEVANNGPDILWLVPSTGAAPGSIVAGKAIPVKPGDVWFMAAGTAIHLYARVENADQITGAATMVTEYGD